MRRSVFDSKLSHPTRIMLWFLAFTALLIAMYYIGPTLIPMVILAGYIGWQIIQPPRWCLWIPVILTVTLAIAAFCVAVLCWLSTANLC